MGNRLIGMLFIIMGCLVLFVVGGYFCLWTGIFQIINGLQADPVSTITIVEGTIRILFACLVAICSSIAIIIGILKRASDREKER